MGEESNMSNNSNGYDRLTVTKSMV